MTTQLLDDPDRPRRLAVAAEEFFGPDSGITAASLRREHIAGRLEIYRIGGKLFTTFTALARMVERAKVPASFASPPTPAFAGTDATAEQAVDRASAAIEQLRGQQ
jgi:hypothetical protein